MCCECVNIIHAIHKKIALFGINWLYPACDLINEFRIEQFDLVWGVNNIDTTTTRILGCANIQKDSLILAFAV